MNKFKIGFALLFALAFFACEDTSTGTKLDDLELSSSSEESGASYSAETNSSESSLSSSSKTSGASTLPAKGVIDAALVGDWVYQETDEDGTTGTVITNFAEDGTFSLKGSGDVLQTGEEVIVISISGKYTTLGGQIYSEPMVCQMLDLEGMIAAMIAGEKEPVLEMLTLDCAEMEDAQGLTEPDTYSVDGKVLTIEDDEDPKNPTVMNKK